jgi:hypothetical protein
MIKLNIILSRTVPSNEKIKALFNICCVFHILLFSLFTFFLLLKYLDFLGVKITYQFKNRHIDYTYLVLIIGHHLY